MRAIMISIKPFMVEKILNGEKTIEIRKTMPKCELPCKVYIYCTYGAKLTKEPDWEEYKRLQTENPNSYIIARPQVLNGKVVAEFTLNKVDTIDICDPYIFRNKEQEDWMWFKSYACLDAEKIMDYIGYGCNQDGWCMEYDKGYAWHIDNLKIYYETKELSEFTHYIPNNECPTKQCGTNCEDCIDYDEEHNTCLELYYLYRQLKRPPRNYCYVEEMESE